MRGTRIRWDGTLRVLAIGLGVIAALLALPRLLAEEPPPPPEDVGLTTLPPPAPQPSPAPTAPLPSPQPDAARKKKKRDRDPRHAAGKRDRKPAKADHGDQSPAPDATVPWTYAPPAPTRENFGFEP